MSDNYEVVYIFKRVVINNSFVFVIKDLVTGRYDKDMEVFVGSNSKIYRYILFSGKKEGFGLRNCIIDFDIINNSRFYFEIFDNVFYLIREYNDMKEIFYDIDLDDFNNKYYKLCNDIRERKLVKLKNNKGN